MTDRYVGPGGSDGNSGLTWALRKETLNGVEDTPVVAGDTIYVGAGSYREMLTVDVTGTSGNEITYLGDITGEYTDGVGGIVRVTGLDTDTGTPQRDNHILIDGKNYRTFRGFVFDNTNQGSIGNFGAIRFLNACDNIIIEDCVFGASYWDSIPYDGGAVLCARGTSGVTNLIVRRCFVMPLSGTFLNTGVASVRALGLTIENCFMFHGGTLRIVNHTGVTVRHITAYRKQYGSYWSNNSTGSMLDTWQVSARGFEENAASITDDYNLYYVAGTDRDGVNDIIGFKMLKNPTLLAGYRFPYNALLARNYPSDYVRVPTTSGLTEDMFGIKRAPSGKQERGAIALSEAVRDTTTISRGSTSIQLPDAGHYQFTIPVVGGSKISIGVDVLHEADYTGTKPQVIIKRTQYADQTLLSTGNADQWTRLSYSFVPDAGEQFITIEFHNNNTATSGNYAAYFDNVSIKSGTGKKIPLNWINKYRTVYRLVSKAEEDEWLFGDAPFTPGAGAVAGPFPTHFNVG